MLKNSAIKESERRIKKIRATAFSPLGLLGHFRDLGQYTDLIYTLSEHRVRVRYKQSALGITWAVMQPLSLMLIYTVIFSRVAKIETNGEPYAIFVFVGLLPWTYFSTAITSGTSALTSHINLISKVYFPREILPLTYVIAAFFDFIIALVVLAMMMIYYRVNVSFNALYAIPIIAVMTGFVMSMVLILSATQVRFRDVGVGIPLLLQIWMFATPVVYPLSAIKSLPPFFALRVYDESNGWCHRKLPPRSFTGTSARIPIAGNLGNDLHYLAAQCLCPLQANRDNGSGGDLTPSTDYEMIDLRFDRVSKRYLIRNEDGGDSSHNPVLRKLKSVLRRPQEFWAVRDVSFEVLRGEALGIIGHNGAGKSTILKLLSSITIPSSGEITINGRLAALIEVGSGFHPELTGRENVYLSGSILGMRRSEIARKIDSIIDFAGILQFIDIPVKRYSSGMFVRLGFSIAAHLDPDILLLDEVLAVGDAAFQSKCLNRIDELRDAGKTIIFISHDLNAVERLCDRVLLMDHGKVIASGQPAEIIDLYKNSAGKSAASAFPGIKAQRDWPDAQTAPGDDIVRLRQVRITTADGETTSAIDIRQPIHIEMTYEVLEPGHILVPNFNVFNQERLHLFNIQESTEYWRRRPRPVGRYVSSACIPGNFFAEGSIVVDANVTSHIPVFGVHLHQRDAVAFSVIDSFDGDAARGYYTGPFAGLVRPLVDWSTHLDVDSLDLEQAEIVRN